MNRFEGKVALVTGSSQGIGAACAIRLASEGANIIINSRVPDDRGQAVVDQVNAMGRRAVFVAADVSNTQNVVNLVQESVKAFGQLDILVNNAGVERNHN